MGTDRNRYKAYIESLDYKNLIPTVDKTETEGGWTPLISRFHYRGRTKGPEPTKWKMWVLEDLKLAPKSWAATDYDDSTWTEVTQPMSWQTNHSALFRAAFEVKNTGAVKKLKLNQWAFRQQQMKVYLNGALIAIISPSGSGGKEIEIPLNEFAVASLREGQNILSATYKQNWRWGRYVRKKETLRSPSVYNHGVHLTLEMHQ